MEHIDEKVLDDYVMGGVSWRERFAVGRHVVGCDACWKQMNQFEAVFQDIEDFGGHPHKMRLSVRAVAFSRAFKRTFREHSIWANTQSF